MKNQRKHVRHHTDLILVLVGLVSAATLMLASAGRASAQAGGPSWSYTGKLNAARSGHTATLLPGGKVLVTGGANNGFLNSAELYDPATATWSVTGSLNLARLRFTTTLLPNGKVLVAGGFTPLGIPTNTAELYDPTTGAWSLTGNLNSPRAWHSATLLRTGKVLIAGGIDEGGYVEYSSLLNSAELYDPETGMWSVTGSLNTGLGHVVHTATLLQNGKVLVAGGSDVIYDPWTVDEEVDSALVSAELYDPSTGSWSVTGSLNTGRIFHTATLLPNGNVLVAGGGGLLGEFSSATENTAELYSPTTGKWSYAGNLSRRWYHTATLLRNGQVLVTGGVNYDYGLPWTTFNTAEIYDPVTSDWSSTASLNAAREYHTATLLPNGKVLAVGGDSAGGRAELYDSGSSFAPNEIDDAQFFVRQQYSDFLNREPDSSGLAFWTNEIASCGLEQQCVDGKRVNTSAAFFLSIEFQQTGYLVYRIYKVSYGNLANAPVPVKFNEFLPDTQEIGHGVVVGQMGWEEVLENNKQSFSDEFVNRPRFTSAYPQSMTPAEFVDKLNTNVGNPLSPAERDRLVSDLQTGVRTRGQILSAVAEDPDLIQAEFNRTFVLMQYFGYLRRDPDAAPDGDFSGYNFWLQKLDQFNGDFAQAEMVKAFISSTEYRRRFGR